MTQTLGWISVVAVLAPFLLPLPGATCSGQTVDDVHALAAKAQANIQNTRSLVRRAELLTKVASILARNNEEEFAYELLQETLPSIADKKRADLLTGIAEVLAEAGYYNDALEIVASMRQDQPSYSEYEIDRCLRGVVLKTSAQGDLNRARQLCLEIVDGFTRALAMRDVAVDAWRAGNMDLAGQCAREAFFYANHIEELATRSQTVEFVIEGFLEEGMAGTVHELVADNQRNPARDGWYHIMRLESLYGNVNGFKRAATKWMKRSGPQSRRDWIHVNLELAEILANAGRLEEAHATLREVVDDESYGLSANRVAEAYLTRGRIEEAQEISETIDPEKHGSHSFTRILLRMATYLSETNHPAEAEKLIRRAGEHLSALNFEQYSELFSEVAYSYGKLGFTVAGEAWADSLVSPEARAAVLIGLADGILARKLDK